MSFIAESLIGNQIDSVHVDSEVTYIMLTNGTQITIHGLMIVNPATTVRVTSAVRTDAAAGAA